MAHQCGYPVCTAYCSGMPFVTDICNAGHWRDTVFIQKRSAGGIQFEVDLFSPLHFKATKALQQQGYPEVLWERPDDAAPRFASRIQLDHFDAEKVFEDEQKVKRRKRKIKKSNVTIDRFKNDLQYYDTEMQTIQDNHALEDVEHWDHALACNIKNLLETRTHVGDNCRHSVHDCKNCPVSIYMYPPEEWTNRKNYAALCKHSLATRTANLHYMAKRIPSLEDNRRLFSVKIAQLNRKRRSKHGDWDKNEEEVKTCSDYTECRKLIDYTDFHVEEKKQCDGWNMDIKKLS